MSAASALWRLFELVLWLAVALIVLEWLRS
jgi:hypothetical protein